MQEPIDLAEYQCGVCLEIPAEIVHRDKYVGRFKDDKEHGKGTYTYADGRKYAGQWKDGELHGEGTFTWADGTVLHQGEWAYGKPVHRP